ncbi:MAG: hypothetical protein FWD70_02905 [Desulfuromonadales bacterium]|nr:hypothetical protein [Desulfuromonadales bacterium]
MTDTQFLYLILVIIYLIECCFWLPRNSIAFIKGSGWKIKSSAWLLGNSNGAFAFAWPFPLLGKAFIGTIPSISISQEGIANRTIEGNPRKSSKAATIISYDNISSISNIGKIVYINETEFYKSSSEKHALKLVEILSELWRSNKREKDIQNYTDSLFDIDTLDKNLTEFNIKTKTLTWLCNIHFIIMFIIAPIIVYVFGVISLIISALFIIIFNFVVIGFYYYSHSNVYPEFKGERITDIIKMGLCPPMTVRGRDYLSLHYLCSFHPVAIAFVLLPAEKAEEFAKKTLLDFNKNITSNSDSVIWHYESMKKEITAFIEKRGIDINKLLAPPEPEAGVLSYCPACHAQYTFINGTCSECNNVNLVPYDGEKDG